MLTVDSCAAPRTARSPGRASNGARCRDCQQGDPPPAWLDCHVLGRERTTPQGLSGGKVLAALPGRGRGRAGDSGGGREGTNCANPPRERRTIPTRLRASHTSHIAFFLSRSASGASRLPASSRWRRRIRVTTVSDPSARRGASCRRSVSLLSLTAWPITTSGRGNAGSGARRMVWSMWRGPRPWDGRFTKCGPSPAPRCVTRSWPR